MRVEIEIKGVGGEIVGWESSAMGRFKMNLGIWSGLEGKKEVG